MKLIYVSHRRATAVYSLFCAISSHRALGRLAGGMSLTTPTTHEIPTSTGYVLMWAKLAEAAAGPGCSSPPL